MLWTSTSGLKSWDFTCYDESKTVVVRVRISKWHQRRMGRIDFLVTGAANNDAFREEMVLLGLTLFYCRLSKSIGNTSLWGMIFADTEPLKKDGESLPETSDPPMYGEVDWRSSASPEREDGTSYGPKHTAV